MSWTDDSSALVNRLRSYLTGVTDAHTREQVTAWVRAWDDVAPDLEAALNELALQATDGRIRRADAIKSQRLLNAITVIQDRLGTLVDGSAASIVDQLSDVVDYAGGMQERIIASQLPRAAAADISAWSRVSAVTIDAMVARTTGRIEKATRPLSAEAGRAMRRTLVRGVAVGENPRTVAAQMVRRTEGIFNGGLSRALTIARTEMLDAHRAASAVADQANADLLSGWTWVASLGPRTCPACWGMHGQEFDLDTPGPLGHQNCRCTRAPKTKTWAELGFDIDEPPSLLPSAGDQFAALPQTEQLQVLGRSRFDAYKAGDYPMDAWATRKSNDGWRDSYVVAPAPKAA